MGGRKPLLSAQARSYMAAMVTIVSWASAFPATRYLLQYYSPGAIMLLRFLLAVLILVVIGFIKKIRLPKLKDMPLIVALGISGVFLFNFFLNTGTINVVSGVSSFIVGTSPVFILILARIFLKEKVKPICWVGVSISFCGLMGVTLSQTIGFSFNTGILLLVGAALSGSILSITQRQLVKIYTTLEVTTYAIIVGTACMLVYLPDILREFPGSPWQFNLAIVYMSIFPAVLAYLTWGYALSKAEKTTHVTVFLYLIPFLASLIGFVWLNETFSLVSLLGGVVIVAGMVLTNVFGRSR